MAALQFQPHSSTLLPKSSNRRNNPRRHSCITIARIGLEAPSNHRFNFRLKDYASLRLLLRSKTIPPHASNSDSEETSSDSVSKDTTEASYAGPPFLTILAGILVFIVVCWAFGSLVVWLLSLIVKVPSSSSPK